MKKKKVICLILVVIGCISSVIIINYLKPDKTSNSLIAVYYEDENGNYQKSKENKFYKEGYALDKEKSKCDNGSTIDWNNETNKIKITGTKTDKCNIYLSKKEYTLLTQNTEIKDKDAKLTNLIKNGSFENEFDNWYNYKFVEIVPTSETHGQKALKSRANSMNTTDDAIVNQTIDNGIVSNHDYYGSIKFKSGLEYTTRDARFEIYDYYILFFQKNSKINDWTLLSAIKKSPSDTSNSPKIFRDFNSGNNIDTYTDELMVIDLTESYGESTPTQDWLDKHLIYFDNSVDIKTTTGKEGIFEVDNTTGTFRCSEGGSGRIENGKVVITGTNVNTTCILE